MIYYRADMQISAFLLPCGNISGNLLTKASKYEIICMFDFIEREIVYV